MKKSQETFTLELEAPSIAVSKVANKIAKDNGLDFIIVKRPFSTTKVDDNGDVVELPSPYYGLYREDNDDCLHSVTKMYHPTQNVEVIELVLRGIKGYGDLKVTKAGELNGGRRIFVQLEVDGFARVGNDHLKKYITIIDSNDGSTGFSVGIGDLTMSCENQFFKFSRKKGRMVLKHNASIDEKLKQLPNLITLAINEHLQLIQAYNQFEKTPAHKMLVDQLVKDLVGIDRAESLNSKDKISTRKINTMQSLYRHIHKEMKDKGQNLWGLHSGVTSWTTHEKTAPNRVNGRLESNMSPSGTNYGINQKSLNFALEHAGIEL